MPVDTDVELDYGGGGEGWGKLDPLIVSFRRVRPPGKPFLVFEPKDEDEKERLAKFINLPIFEERILHEPNILNPDDIAGQRAVFCSVIYPVRMRSGPGVYDYDLTTKNGEEIFLFILLIQKRDRYVIIWHAFLCDPENSYALKAEEKRLVAEYQTQRTLTGPTVRFIGETDEL